jgi:3-oxoacyl-[acyl-carrier-protein] synthase-3
VGYTSFSIIGTGHALPVNNIHNIDIATHLDTIDEWIVQRTGFSSYRFVNINETMTTLAAEASGRQLASSQRVASDLGLVILCTSTLDNLFGSASLIQHAIGAVNAASFDITSACSGLAVGFNVAVHMSSSYRTAMVIVADTLSRFLDMNDRSTCVLFGDGASAIHLILVCLCSIISSKLARRPDYPNQTVN